MFLEINENSWGSINTPLQVHQEKEKKKKKSKNENDIYLTSNTFAFIDVNSNSQHENDNLLTITIDSSLGVVDCDKKEVQRFDSRLITTTTTMSTNQKVIQDEVGGTLILNHDWLATMAPKSVQLIIWNKQIHSGPDDKQARTYTFASPVVSLQQQYLPHHATSSSLLILYGTCQNGKIFVVTNLLNAKKELQVQYLQTTTVIDDGAKFLGMTLHQKQQQQQQQPPPSLRTKKRKAAAIDSSKYNNNNSGNELQMVIYQVYWIASSTLQLLRYHISMDLGINNNNNNKIVTVNHVQATQVESVNKTENKKNSHQMQQVMRMLSVPDSTMVTIIYQHKAATFARQLDLKLARWASAPMSLQEDTNNQFQLLSSNLLIATNKNELLVYDICSGTIVLKNSMPFLSTTKDDNSKNAPDAATKTTTTLQYHLHVNHKQNSIFLVVILPSGKIQIHNNKIIQTMNQLNSTSAAAATSSSNSMTLAQRLACANMAKLTYNNNKKMKSTTLERDSFIVKTCAGIVPSSSSNLDWNKSAQKATKDRTAIQSALSLLQDTYGKLSTGRKVKSHYLHIAFHKAIQLMNGDDDASSSKMILLETNKDNPQQDQSQEQQMNNNNDDDGDGDFNNYMLTIRDEEIPQWVSSYFLSNAIQICIQVLSNRTIACNHATSQNDARLLIKKMIHTGKISIHDFNLSQLLRLLQTPDNEDTSSFRFSSIDLMYTLIACCKDLTEYDFVTMIDYYMNHAKAKDVAQSFLDLGHVGKESGIVILSVSDQHFIQQYYNESTLLAGKDEQLRSNKVITLGAQQLLHMICFYAESCNEALLRDAFRQTSTFTTLSALLLANLFCKYLKSIPSHVSKTTSKPQDAVWNPKCTTVWISALCMEYWNKEKQTSVWENLYKSVENAVKQCDVIVTLHATIMQAFDQATEKQQQQQQQHPKKKNRIENLNGYSIESLIL